MPVIIILIALILRLSFTISIIILYVISFYDVNIIQSFLVLSLLIFIVNESKTVKSNLNTTRFEELSN